MKAPGRMPATRQSAAKKNIAASENLSVSPRLRGRRRAGAAEKGHAECLYEAGSGECCGERQERADGRHQ